MPDENKRSFNEDFADSYTRTMERRIRELETERQLLEVQRDKLEKERDNLKLELRKLHQPPLFVGTLCSMLENGQAIVKSSTGPLFAVVVDSSIPPELLIPGAHVVLHQRNFALLKVIPKQAFADLKSFQGQLDEIKSTLKSLLEILSNRLPE